MTRASDHGPSGIPDTATTHEADEPGVGELTGAVLLAGLMFVGSVKATPALAWLPVDPTAIIAAIVAVLCVVQVLRRMYVPRGTLVSLLFMLTLVPGVLPADWSPIAQDKITRLFTITLVSLVGPTILLGARRAQRVFVLTTAWIALGLTALSMLSSPDPTLGGRLSLGDDTIGLARVAGTYVVIGSCIYLYGLRRRVLALVGAAICTLAVVGSGSRGPAIATVIALVFSVGVLGTSRRADRIRRSALILACVVIAIPLVVSLSPGSAVQRFVQAVSTDPGHSVLLRQYMYDHSLAFTMTNPIGVGWGNISTVIGQVDEGTGGVQYSHNVLLEAAVEGGWLALIGLVALIGFSARAAFTRRQQFEPGVLSALLVFWVVAASFSGDLNSNRSLFVIAGACLALIATRHGSRARPVTAGRGNPSTIPQTTTSPGRRTMIRYRPR